VAPTPVSCRCNSCTYSTEDGSYAADCGTLVVPENRQTPTSRLIALPVTRVRTKSTPAGTPLFYLQGGPGVTNMEVPDGEPLRRERATFVLVGYRGVDGSVKLDCPEVVNALTGVSDLVAKKHPARVLVGLPQVCRNGSRDEAST